MFFALFSLLSLQVAVAGYACPVELTAREAAAVAQAEMPCAGQMEQVDSQQPGLCHAHCQPEQSMEKLSSTAVLAPVSPGFSYTVQPAKVAERVQAEQSSFYHATAPPILVRNCCLRI